MKFRAFWWFCDEPHCDFRELGRRDIQPEGWAQRTTLTTVVGYQGQTFQKNESRDTCPNCSAAEASGHKVVQESAQDPKLSLQDPARLIGDGA